MDPPRSALWTTYDTTDEPRKVLVATLSFGLTGAQLSQPQTVVSISDAASIQIHGVEKRERVFKPEDEVQMTPGKVMLLPEQNPETDCIMVATGAGIAPYRSFLRRLSVENTPAAKAYNGEAWLFLGVANSGALLYVGDWQDITNRDPANSRSGKMYADEVFTKLEKGGPH
jgi:Oxidoreductase NAD-binding domain